MHWLDALLLALLILGAVVGARSGLLRQVARLLGFGVALYVTVFFHVPAAAFLHDNFMKEADEQLVSVVAYVMVFCVIYLSIFFGTLLIEGGVRAMRLETMNRLLGAILGLSQAALLLGAAFLALATYPQAETQELIGKSALVPVLALGVERILIALPSDYRAELHNGLEELKHSIKAQTEGGKGAGK